MEFSELMQFWQNYILNQTLTISADPTDEAPLFSQTPLLKTVLPYQYPLLALAANTVVAVKAMREEDRLVTLLCSPKVLYILHLIPNRVEFVTYIYLIFNAMKQDGCRKIPTGDNLWRRSIRRY